MPEPKGNLVVMGGFRADGTLRAVLLGDDDSLGGGTTPHALLDGSIDSDTVAGSPLRGDLIRGSSTPKWERYALGAANRVLSSDGSDAIWQTLATLLKDAILTTNGDLLIVDGAGTVTRLGIGAAAQVLTVSGGLPSWQPAASTGAMVQIQRIALGVNGTIDFQNIPATYNGLRIEAMVRGSNNAVVEQLYGRMNNDSGNNYFSYYIYWYQAAQTGAVEAVAAAQVGVAHIAGNTAGANKFSSLTIDIPEYANGGMHKGFTSQVHWMETLLTGGIRTGVGGGTWASLAAINRITLYGQGTANLLAGSVATLYGVT